MSKNRWVVERVSGSIKRWFGFRKGSLHRISSCACPSSLWIPMAYILYHCPGIIMCCS
ncbi:MAG: hypothetical protein ACMUEL_05210 [Flavobacteriales bacterium Tduv]